MNSSKFVHLFNIFAVLFIVNITAFAPSKFIVRRTHHVSLKASSDTPEVSHKEDNVVVTLSDTHHTTIDDSQSSNTNKSEDDDEGLRYISCGSCKSIYLYDNMKALTKAIGARGSRVKCSVCDKQWFQSLDKVGKVDNSMAYQPVSREKADEIRKFIRDNGRHHRGDKIDLFIGNVPYNYDENDLADLFAEYGVLGTTVVRDQEKQSKGFAFIELGTRQDADQAIEEMDGFYLDNSRKLVVKLSTRAAGGPPPGGRGPNTDGTSGGGGGGDRRAWSRPPGGEGGASTGPAGGSGGAPATPRNVWVPKNR